MPYDEYMSETDAENYLEQANISDLDYSPLDWNDVRDAISEKMIDFGATKSEPQLLDAFSVAVSELGLYPEDFDVVEPENDGW